VGAERKGGGGGGVMVGGVGVEGEAKLLRKKGGGRKVKVGEGKV